MDNGTCDSLLETSKFVKKIENKKKTMIFCPELIAFKKKWINKKQLKQQILSLSNADYGRFLKKNIF